MPSTRRRRIVVEQVSEAVRFRLLGRHGQRVLERLLDVATFDGALARIGTCRVEWRDAPLRRETVWVVVALTRLEVVGPGRETPWARHDPGAITRIDIDPRTGRRALMRQLDRVASLAAIEPSAPACRDGHGHDWHVLDGAPTVLDRIERCGRCGWSRERIDAIERRIGQDRGAPAGDGLDPDGAWERYLPHDPALADACVPARLDRTLRVVVRLPAKRGGEARRRWIDPPPRTSANEERHD